ncbi:hypothetical protein [Providencia phage PSTCR2]|uniref:Uncharacterized protein n=1 Tax=Providencia phage PSTCR2 TaxID=2783544 RepID=A0A873WH80_9CAUD|nr:hypothetical protein [Providencia phage PSTCR2]
MGCKEQGILTMETTTDGCYYERSNMLIQANSAYYTRYTCSELLTESAINIKHYSSITIDGVEYVR